MKNNLSIFLLLALLLTALTSLMTAQEESESESTDFADTLTIPFSENDEPKSLYIHLLNGSITVEGYDGEAVIAEARPRSKTRQYHSSRSSRDGLRALTIRATGLFAEEQNNKIKIGLQQFNEIADLTIKVPFQIDLKLECVNNGDIVVKDVEGEMDINNVNGNVRLDSVSGVVVAHALNGNLTAVLNSVTESKNMSFTSMNGDIDVTLPANTGAELKLETANGNIFSDFDITLSNKSRKPIVDDRRDRDGKFRLKFEKAIFGTINGGGPLYYFKSHNGEILIRQGE